ncbi:hypothetical protein NPS01_13320 [Nocardioides psychrotolerans]|uniref:Matrixin n=1 Tax=Nocardioides psychrotolerans TaxID=1005945 RepID=A0A1I3HBP5_9ACTN|nr:matrixin family metalloprotease [Nocardioides psychrotolerans]GEP37669.1 hypothetical protein NPS01_13320 [Nocardioides psychrotolerans]SFI33094.1 Matrixin [Nocardioides psychrotolerans]
MGWSERRAQREWERDLLRQIRALETTDEGPDGGQVTRLRRQRVRRPPRRPRRAPAVRRGRAPGERRRTFVTIGVTLSLIGALLLLNVVPGAYQLRNLLGLDDRLGAAVDGGSSGAYRFLSTRPGTDDPIGWDPCRPIAYEVNPAGAPDSWESLVGDAVATISRATGLVFEDEGVTDDRAFDERFRAGIDPRPVLIGWATSDEVPGLKGDVAGLAGPISTSDGVLTRYVTGRVVLDSEAFEQIERFRGAEEQQRAIVLHELAHLVGLDHVDDPSQLMYRTTEVTRFGRGDLRGLALVGDAPCG